MMRTVFGIVFLAVIATAAACDLRSETAKREMEKFTSSPTPTFSPTPTAEPIDPADIVTVDASLQGDSISIDGYEQKRSADCSKFNRLMVNGDKNIITIKGVCQRIMVNGDKNQVTADAAMEIVINGTENTINYSRFANGQRPSVIQNRPGNTVERIATKNKK